jgi:hypothetical protein
VFGQTLLANHGDRLECIKLEHIVENTRTFSRFSFSRPGADGPSQKDIIMSLKQLLKDALNPAQTDR